MKSKLKTTALLKEYILRLINEELSEKRLRIFDFDDTLVITDAKIFVNNILTGKNFILSPGEFAVYEKNEGDEFDFSEFQKLVNPRAIIWTGKIIRNIYKKYGPSGFVILSARTSAAPIHQFLEDAEMPGIEIVALNNADPNAKAQKVDEWITQRNIDVVEFFDDSPKNIAAVKALNIKHPNVKIIGRHVVHTHMPTHGFTKS
jgi:hypothetical protein